MRKYRTDKSLVKRFGRTMLHKLRLNAEKGHWSTVDDFELLRLLKLEVVELEEALIELHAHKDHDHCEELASNVQYECGDVGNFCAFIADNAARRCVVTNSKSDTLEETG